MYHADVSGHLRAPGPALDHPHLAQKSQDCSKHPVRKEATASVQKACILHFKSFVLFKLQFEIRCTCYKEYKSPELKK